MKKNSATISLALRARHGNLPQIIITLVLLSLVSGMLTETSDEMLAYMLITIICGVPCVLWISAGTPGIPLLPPICAMFYLYYALPIVRNNVHSHLSGFDPSEILSAAISIVLFIVAATVPWWLLLARNIRSDAAEMLSGRRLTQIIFFGLASGMLFYIVWYSGWVNWLGPFFGTVRSVMFTITN